MKSYCFATIDGSSQWIEGCEFRFGAFATSDESVAEMLRKKVMVKEIFEIIPEETTKPKTKKGK